MKDRDKLMHECINLAKETARMHREMDGFYSSIPFLNEPRVYLSEERYLEMFPDAKGFRIGCDGCYELETYVDGVRFFCDTDEVADDA